MMRLSPDDPQGDLLVRFIELLHDRAVPLGLIGRADRGQLRRRHVDDSLRALVCVGSDVRMIADLGSGAGLPGIPLAIALPDVAMVLVEPRRSRVAFLEFVVGELGLGNVRVEAATTRQLSLRVDLCAARALGDAVRSYDLAAHLMQPEGGLLYFAGASWPAPGELEGLSVRGVSWDICASPMFPSGGPIVMMRSADSFRDEETTDQHS